MLDVDVLMPSRDRQLHLNAFLSSSGHHEAAWRLQASDPRADFDPDHWRGLAQLAERGRFDSVFLADRPALTDHGGFRPGGSLEPTIVLTLMAEATERIGLIATASTTYNDPYNLARRFASLDHVSGGRVRLERRHHLRPGRGAELLPAGAPAARGALRARA